MNKSISIKSLSKSYKELKVLENVNMEIAKGKIIGLVGRNGSGKSTLIKNIMKFISFDKGNISVDDVDINEKDILDIGHYISEANFYPNFTGYQNLAYFLNMKEDSLWKYDEIYQAFEMNEALNRKYRTYSLGMKQRFGLIFLLTQEKGYFLLDEPLSGLDYQGKLEFKKLIKKNVENKACGVLIVSHQLENLEGFCDEIWYIQNKKIKLLDVIKKDIEYKLVFADEESCAQAINQLPYLTKKIDNLSFKVKIDSENEIENIIKKASERSLREVVKVANSIISKYENAIIGEHDEK
ncbi:MAG: ATP-binding cassette domain-containing protein [Candidatus Izemoplasmatales bacterium]